MLSFSYTFDYNFISNQKYLLNRCFQTIEAEQNSENQNDFFEVRLMKINIRKLFFLMSCKISDFYLTRREKHNKVLLS